MYLDIIPKLKSTLEDIVIYTHNGTDYTATVYPHPLNEGETPSDFPAIVFYPTDADNEFSSTESNFKEINFSAIVLVNAEQLTNEELFTYTLPNAADEIIEGLDKGWDFGTTDDNNRMWARADAIVWGKEMGESGEYGFVDINIIIKLENNLQ